MRDLIARVGALPADTAIIYEGIWSGGTALDSTPEAALAAIAAAANRPIVVDTEIWSGFGAAGGFLTRPALDGQVATQVAMRILNGESAANIPVVVGDVNRPLFDWRQLKRFGISEDQRRLLANARPFCLRAVPEFQCQKRQVADKAGFGLVVAIGGCVRDVSLYRSTMEQGSQFSS